MFHEMRVFCGLVTLNVGKTLMSQGSADLLELT